MKDNLLRKNKMLGKLDSTKRSSIVNMALKPLSVILSLFYTPLLLTYLGNEKYGLWSTVLSIISWINYFDIGIGNGLRNTLSTYISEKEYRKAKYAVSTAYLTLSAISIFIFIILLFCIVILDWKLIFSTSVEMELVLLISFFFICLNFILSLGNILLYALQLSEQVAIRNFLAQIINVIGLLVLSYITQGELVFVAVLFGASQLIVNITNSIQIMYKYSFLKPSLKDVKKQYLTKICNMGLKFFIIQIMCLMMFTIDNLLITHYWGAEVVTPFSIINKVYNTIYSVFSAFMVPYWSKTTVAYKQKNFRWIKSAIKYTFSVSVIFIIGYIVMIFWFKPIALIWLNKRLEYQSGLLLVMAIFYILYSILTVECQFINGTGEIDIQLIVYIIVGVLNIPLSIFLGVRMEMMAMGVRMATIFLVLFADIILGINLRYIIKKGERVEV